MKKSIYSIGILLGLAGLHSCAVAPVNADYETAETLGKGKIEAMGSITGYHGVFIYDIASSNNYNFGLRLGLGVSEKIDLKIRYEKIVQPPNTDWNPEGSQCDFFRITPKFSLSPNKWAITVPFSAYLYSNYSYYAFGVTAYRTFQIDPKVSFTLGFSNQNLFTTSEGESGVVPLVGTSFGLSFYGSENFHVRPEIGFLTNVWGFYLNYGIAFVFIL